MEIPAVVASAAGPDLREMILGSEGRLGVMTTAMLRVSRLPEYEQFQAVFFADFENGVAAVREIAQSRLPLSMVRLSDADETKITLALSNQPKITTGLEWILRQQGIGDTKCMLILGATGSVMARAVLRQALNLAHHYHAISIAGPAIGSAWRKSRFRNPYLRNTLWEQGYVVETVETAADWTHLNATKDKIQSSLRSGLADIGERVHSFTHLSHVYPTGSSIYTTYLYRIVADPVEILRRWQVLKSAASRVIVEMGATISHQHGVGTDHLPYITHEKHELGLQALQGICALFDPHGLMNPGKLVDTKREINNGL